MMLIFTLLRTSLPVQVLALGLLAWIALKANNFYQRQIGASQTLTKIEKANENATDLGTDAAARSLDGRVRGKRDPSTRDH